MDSGLSGSATPPHEDGAGPTDSSSPALGEELSEEEERRRDEEELSELGRRDEEELSDMSEESGKDWKPEMSGKLSWLHR